MASYAQGIFTPTQPEKYIGKGNPRYRSGWEFTFMQFCDKNKNILKWASESIVIPYIHPLTGKRTNYIPDFLVVYENKNGLQRAELVEIKPKKQSIIESKMSAQNRAVVAVNHAKWAAAMAFCKQSGMTFRVITEDQLFHNGKNK
jgi:hypothetical protein